MAKKPTGVTLPPDTSTPKPPRTTEELRKIAKDLLKDKEFSGRVDAGLFSTQERASLNRIIKGEYKAGNVDRMVHIMQQPPAVSPKPKVKTPVKPKRK